MYFHPPLCGSQHTKLTLDLTHPIAYYTLEGNEMPPAEIERTIRVVEGVDGRSIRRDAIVKSRRPE